MAFNAAGMMTRRQTLRRDLQTQGGSGNLAEAEPDDFLTMDSYRAESPSPQPAVNPWRRSGSPPRRSPVGTMAHSPRNAGNFNTVLQQVLQQNVPTSPPQGDGSPVWMPSRDVSPEGPYPHNSPSLAERNLAGADSQPFADGRCRLERKGERPSEGRLPTRRFSSSRSPHEAIGGVGGRAVRPPSPRSTSPRRVPTSKVPRGRSHQVNSRMARDLGRTLVSEDPGDIPYYTVSYPRQSARGARQEPRSGMFHERHYNPVEDMPAEGPHLRTGRHGWGAGEPEPQWYPGRSHSSEASQQGYQPPSQWVSGVKISLPRFDGQIRWQTFINQFEAVTHYWPVDQRLHHLLASLTGEAADYVFDLDRGSRSNYFHLVEELERRFHVAETPQTCARQFYRRKLRSTETLRQFAADLKVLIRKAYPRGVNCVAMEQMLIKQFFDGLDDEDLRYNVEYLKMPYRLDEAVDLVMEHDEFKGLKRGVEKNRVRVIASQHEDLQELMDALHKLAQRLDQLELSRPNLNVSDSRLCYRCGEAGHFKRQCPKKVPKQEQSADNNHCRANTASTLNM